MRDVSIIISTALRLSGCGMHPGLPYAVRFGQGAVVPDGKVGQANSPFLKKDQKTFALTLAEHFGWFCSSACWQTDNGLRCRRPEEDFFASFFRKKAALAFFLKRVAGNLALQNQ